MRAGLAFAKYEGIGNDFILLAADAEDALPPARAVRLCDRRFGVGADGVLLLLPPRRDDCVVRMRVVNADGSVPEMCGNGLRCVALHVVRSGPAAASSRGPRTIRVDTDAGPRDCAVDDTGGQGWVTVQMGGVRVLGDRVLEVAGRRAPLILADAGNPHAILFGAFARSEVEELGPRIATHADFPNGTNVEFASVKGDDIDLVVWERGVGITLACGTGACATAAVAASRGLVPTGTPVPVRLPGGTLEVTVDADGRTTMRGPARHVFSGTLAPDAL
ncbi:MAG: diaminopimelate epimerase [Myxococcales bacterium]|nr:diaminopimelate epimerase [Myxococcales bacterium]